ncbi:TetR/AcrR family transcriptional regulator [Bradyrhizobium prioriisuperbiae]|uniref:TetR/AcrR family transcriptional regulator n=1 Tax=Bradyrhizobium prioriisuperbiae TaxID=2854389 RepID=UPI0028E3EB6D|nr:TetR/AcrR family transcriptional regulator [Bradyrhizobium prioritasuperba]
MNNVQEPSSNSRKSERHAHLLETARALIAAKGLRSLKVRDVATAAGCAVGTVYNEFEDFDALVIAVNRDTLDALDGALSTLEDDDPVRHLHRLAQGYLDFATAHPNLLRSLYEHRMEGDRPFPQDLLDKVQSTFALMYPPLVRLLPDYPSDDVALLARMMFSAVHGIISLGIEERLVAVPPQQLRRQVSLFVDTYIAGLERQGVTPRAP